MATYEPGDAFPHADAKGFISLWGLPTRTFSLVNTPGQAGKTGPGGLEDTALRAAEGRGRRP